MSRWPQDGTRALRPAQPVLAVRELTQPLGQGQVLHLAPVLGGGLTAEVWHGGERGAAGVRAESGDPQAGARVQGHGGVAGQGDGGAATTL